jgi:DNA primase
MSFLEAYFGVTDNGREQQVLCPFPHHTQSGVPYEESNPSAHINIDKGLFHCKSCGTGLNETQFISRILGCSETRAAKLKTQFANPLSLYEWDERTKLNEGTLQLLKSYGITIETIEELKVRTAPGTVQDICIPVTMYGEIIDLRTYNPAKTPKAKSETGSMTGTIVPYDTWKQSPKARATIICAGEKDMMVARSKDFNAIMIVGGEKALPLDRNAFKDRPCCIVYDNDEAGKDGAEQLARHLHGTAKEVKVVTKFHETCTERGEDITDYFVKYGKEKQDLINDIEATPTYKPSPLERKQKDAPMVTIEEATKPENLSKPAKSNVQVLTVSDMTFSLPTYAAAEDTATGEVREWHLSERKLWQALTLIDSNLKDSLIRKQILSYMGITTDGWKLNIHKHKTLYKADVTDLKETNKETSPIEVTAYSFDSRLAAGQKYLITYQLIPHPLKGRKLTMLITGAEEPNDSVSKFQITEEVKGHLRMFQDISNAPDENLHTQSEMIKDLLGYDGDNTLIKVLDLAFNTPLRFNFGEQKGVRAYLDTMVIGESRTGKSSTATALCNLYQLGVFTILAGNSATKPGLIGGSSTNPSQGMQTRAGVIPSNHKGLIVFEEFSKCNQNIIKELTDIRSSNEVRLARVSGSTTMPAMVRMITLSNPKTVDGQIKSINSYPTGIHIVTDLIESPEDIARYDMIYIMPDTDTNQIDPMWKPIKALDHAAYQNRIRWVWTRTADQIYIDGVSEYIIEMSNKLNEAYAAHIKIFGTETWKKLTRLSIAVAACVCSANESFEAIVVKKEHADVAVSILVQLYDNETFKLKQFVDGERMYTSIDTDGANLLQEVHNKWPALTLQLELVAETSANTLVSSTGFEIGEVNNALGKLTQGRFVKTSVQGRVYPTERFRKGMNMINKGTHITRAGT